MERYFEIKDKVLVQKYEKYEIMSEKMRNTFCEFCEKHGIEAERYKETAEHLIIVSTKNDMEKFGTQIKKNTYGHFKDNSKLAKEWIALCKEKGIETPYKPIWEMSRLMKVQSGVFENRFSSRMFSIAGVLYGSYEIDRDWEFPKTDAFAELKASEFWRIVEDNK